MDNLSSEDIEQLYSRKRELIQNFKEIEKQMLDSSRGIEGKAWNLLSISSAVFGIVSAIQINFVSDSSYERTLLGIGLICVFVYYLILIFKVMAVVKPMKWAIVPGVSNDEELRYDTLEKKYIFDGQPISEDEYLTQLLADYVGNEDVNGSEETFPGSIQKIENNNQLKAENLTIAAKALSYLIVSIVGLSIGTLL